MFSREARKTVAAESASGVMSRGKGDPKITYWSGQLGWLEKARNEQQVVYIGGHGRGGNAWKRRFGKGLMMWIFPAEREKGKGEAVHEKTALPHIYIRRLGRGEGWYARGG